MGNLKIESYSDLILQITLIKTTKKQQEIELRKDFNEFTQSLNPVQIIQHGLSKLANDKTIKFNLKKIGMIAGADLLIDIIFGRNRSIKGFLSAVLVEKIASTYINSIE
jgi:hypothetical protein